MVSLHREGFGSIKIRLRDDCQRNPYEGSSLDQVHVKKQDHEDEPRPNDDQCHRRCDDDGDGGYVNDNVGRSGVSNQFMESDVVDMQHAFPFRFLVPENASDGKCCWIYPVNFGGGLVEGDKIDVDYDVGDNCVAVVSSQELAKVYRCVRGELTRQTAKFHCGESSLLCVLMEPMICFKDAQFLQKQVINMKSSSSVVFLDWMLSGRVALGESWAFKRFRNTVEVFIEEELVLRECSDLEDTELASLAQSMGEYQVLGTLVMLGSYLSSQSKALLERYGRKRDLGEKPEPGLVVSVSPVSYHVKGHEVNGCYTRFMAVDLGTASSLIQEVTRPLLPVLGADPFERKL